VVDVAVADEVEETGNGLVLRCAVDHGTPLCLRGCCLDRFKAGSMPVFVVTSVKIFLTPGVTPGALRAGC
ncbi:MAG TPA: hypothetical protein PLF73_06910, partial [Luteimonas sp.]|nr:hypothetical protein [Luteimonas sp.]